MASSLLRFFRRVRYGKPIIVVSGLPRSGTSLMMQMLEAGGIEIVTDRVRTADESNPQGYYELEAVKELDKGTHPFWLKDARGKAVKIIAFLINYLPETFSYKVIFMHRDIDEVLASQTKMLALRGEPSDTDDARMRELFEGHLARTKRLLTSRACFEVLDISYNEILENASEHAGRVDRFLDAQLDVERMAAVVNPDLYRSRR